jgi:hypothetical protein
VISEFWKRVQALVDAADAVTLSTMVDYPLRVNRSTVPRLIASPDEFVRSFPTIFTPFVREAVHRAEAQAVFCNWQGASLGHGVLWAVRRDSGLKLGAVNLTASNVEPEAPPTPPPGASSPLACAEPALQCR